MNYAHNDHMVGGLFSMNPMFPGFGKPIIHLMSENHFSGVYE
jgi:hypothetical protein